VIHEPYKTFEEDSLQKKIYGHTAVRKLIPVYELMTIQAYTGFCHIEDTYPSKELQINLHTKFTVLLDMVAANCNSVNQGHSPYL
jgi:hypothetical protein